jgi:hypothetical protein
LASIIPIRLRAAVDQRSTVQYRTLDSVRIGFRTRWFAYDAVWRIWLLATDGAQIAGPRALVPGYDIFRPWKYDARVPPGELFVYSDDRSAPTLDTLGATANLYYRPIAEVVS